MNETSTSGSVEAPHSDPASEPRGRATDAQDAETPSADTSSGISREGTSNPVIYPRDQHTISRVGIDPDALKILYRLNSAGFKGYVVGGGVRDLLLGKKPKDFDIATDATPQEVRRLFRNSRVIGRRFKLVHVFFHGGKNIEVSTFRDVSAPPPEPEEGRDEQGEGKQRSVVEGDNTFGTEATDAWRRDLTINGLFYDVSTRSVIDYVGGVEDLKNHIIRIIGDPDVRFEEDPIRMIRVCRHAARTGFSIDPLCSKSMSRLVHLITKASQVRIYEEFKKDLVSGSLVDILTLLASVGLLDHMLPELMANGGSLLVRGNGLLECLAEVDRQVREGDSVSPTVPLAIITLFAGLPALLPEDLMLRFDSRGQIRDHVADLFSKLSVPRKERERIEVLLSTWHSYHHSPAKPMRPQGHDRNEVLADLRALCVAIGDNRRHPDMIDMIDPPSREHRSNISQPIPRAPGARRHGGHQRRPRPRGFTPRGNR